MFKEIEVVNGDYISRHDPYGFVFIKHVYDGVDVYTSVDCRIAYLEIDRCIKSGEWPEGVRKGLVRHGNPAEGRYGYYPLYLVFSGERERAVAARRTGKRPPSNRWIKRRREEIRLLIAQYKSENGV